MKFVANPVTVDAFKIVSVMAKRDGSYTCHLEGKPSEEHICTPEMAARYIPTYGDYWVIQEDGYAYVNPRDVFQRKYKAVDNVA